MMKKAFATTLVAASLMQVCVTAASAADVVNMNEVPDLRGGMKIGYLDCSIGGGLGYVLESAKEVDCVFHHARSGD